MSKIRELAMWTLPNTGEQVRLEVFRNSDGFDAPRLMSGWSKQSLINEGSAAARKRGDFWPGLEIEDQAEADDAYFKTVVEPQAEKAVREYFARRMKRAKKNWNAKPASVKSTYHGRVPLAKALKVLAGELGRLKRRRPPALREAGVTL